MDGGVDSGGRACVGGECAASEPAGVPRGEQGLVRDNKAIDAWIRTLIKEEDAKFYERHPWVARHRNAIAAAVVAFVVVAFVGIVALHYTDKMSTLAAVPTMTFVLATLHEVEHDLFHAIYFGRPGSAGHEAAMWVIHLLKLHVSPWWRMRFHLRHHSVSGHEGDIEERLLGLGDPIGFKRLLLTISPITFLVAVPSVLRDNPNFKWWEPLRGSVWQILVQAVPVLGGLATLLGAVSLAAARFAFVTAAELVEVVVPTRQDARRWLQGLHALPPRAPRVSRQVPLDSPGAPPPPAHRRERRARGPRRRPRAARRVC